MDLPDDLAARFTVVEQFAGGEGQSGAVRAHDGGPLLVLKLLDSGIDPHEAALAASLAHPRIPRIVEVGEAADGRSFLLREHIDGDPLGKLLPLEPDAVVDLAIQLLEILTFVHLRGIVHRDVKPANVLRRQRDGRVEYALLDFGLASRGTDARAGGGTPYFASPEQLAGLAADARSDLYSLGMLLRVALGARHGALPQPLDRAISRLTAHRPSDRYPDAQEALEALAGRTGRPSVALLTPDPIAVHGETVRDAIARSGAVELRGGDRDTRRALALWAAAELGSAMIRDHADATSIERGGGGRTLCELPSISEAQLAAHLDRTVGLGADRAAEAARSLLAAGVHSPADVAARLRAEVEAGAIVPDGATWAWPAAASGRFDPPAAAPIPTEPDAFRTAARAGHSEVALRAYRELCAAGIEPQRDAALRAALAEGLLLGGEPARALPLVADLPALHARALVDLGRVEDAERLLTADHGSHHRLRAVIDHLRGRNERAHERLIRALEDGPDPATRVVMGQVLLALGRHEDALESMRALVVELRSTDARFLLAAATTSLAEAARACGRLDESADAYRRAHEILASLGHVRHGATATSNLGVIAKDRGDFETALALHRRARSLFEHVDDLRGAALALANLGTTSLAMGDTATAISRLEDAAARLDQLGAAQHAAHVRGLLDGIASRRERDRDDRGTMPERDPNEVPKGVFRTFLAVNRRLAVERNLDRAMEHLLDAAVTLTGGRTGYLLLSRGDGLQREFRAGDTSNESLAFSRSMVNRAVQQRRTRTSEDVVDDRELLEMPSVRNLRQRSAICAPFASAGGHEGALYVEHPGRAGVFGDAEKEHLEILADQAAIAVDRMLHEEQLARELEHSQRELAVVKRARKRGPRMLGKSPVMAALRAQIDKVAASELPVLVRGETGSGKELVARAIHDHSPRNRGPFVAENCSAIPEQLMESELFGHVKGAFTGADDDRVGLFELASGGTLFLDEIGDMPAALQAKLLRALQERTIRRVGAPTTIDIDVRLVSATHRDLRALAGSDGGFREDLYYRIAGAEITVPPLRERGEDRVLLAEAFLAELAREHGRTIALCARARQELLDYPWPGNVRELHHVISRAFLLADGEVIASLELPATAAAAAAAEPQAGWPVISLKEAESRTIEAALGQTGGDKTKAAKLLGISRTALYEKLRRMRERPDSGSV